MKKRSLNRISKKKSRIKFLLFSFTLVILLSCTHTKSVSVIYTGKSNGILENCNCPKNKYGGLLNRLFLFNQLKDSIGFILDAGDIFSFRKDNDLNQIILKILPEFKYTAISPGELDLDLVKEIDEILVSQNVYGVKKEVFIEHDNVKFCLTGAIDPEFIKYDKNDLIMKDHNMEDINAYTKTLKSKCDVLVFLSHLEIDNERKLFIENPEIDIMVSGHSGIRTHEKFGNRIYVSPGRNAEFIGKLNLKIKKNDKGQYSIFDHENKFYSMNIDSIPVDVKAKNIVDSMKKVFNIKSKPLPSEDY